MGKPSPWASRDPGGEGRAVPERRCRPQSTWAAGPTGRTEEPGGGVGKRTLIGRGEAPGQSTSAAEGPLPSPLPGLPGAHENPLPLRLWLSWDASSWGHLATSGGAVTKGEGATGADRGGHTPLGAQALMARVVQTPETRLRKHFTPYTLNLRGAQAWDGPADRACSLYLKPCQVGHPCPADPAPSPQSVPWMSNQLLPIQIQSRQLKPYSFLSSFSWAPSPGSRSR